MSRRAEVQRLSQAANEAPVRVISIVGLAGIGKTQLALQVVAFQTSIAAGGPKPVFGWSFDRSAGDLDANAFIREALRWRGDNAPDSGSVRERAQRLVTLLQEEPVILLLDGLDSYQLMAGRRTGRLAHEGISVVLRALSVANPGVCIVTSRMPLTELSMQKSTSAPEFALGRLSTAAGVELLSAHGLRGRHADLAPIVAELHGHPWALKATADLILDRCDGDVLQRRAVAGLQLSGLDSLMEGYEKWFEGRPELSLLRIASCFRQPAPRGLLEKLLDEPAVAPLIPELGRTLERSRAGGSKSQMSNESVLHSAAWKLGARRLRDARLVGPRARKTPDSLSPHPLARLFIQERARQASPQAWRFAKRFVVGHP